MKKKTQTSERLLFPFLSRQSRLEMPANCMAYIDMSKLQKLVTKALKNKLSYAKSGPVRVVIGGKFKGGEK